MTAHSGTTQRNEAKGSSLSMACMAVGADEHDDRCDAEAPLRLVALTRSRQSASESKRADAVGRDPIEHGDLLGSNRRTSRVRGSERHDGGARAVSYSPAEQPMGSD